MPRPREGAAPLTPAERVSRSRRRQAARLQKLEVAARHVADGIALAREVGGHWTEDQRQAWFNGLETAARRALEPG